MNIWHRFVATKIASTCTSSKPARAHLFSCVTGSPSPGGRAAPARLPSWITEADIEYYAGKRASFRGGFNWYRNIDR